MRQNKKSPGVTLIELIMAMVILSVVALATATMIQGQLAGVVQSSQLLSAGNAARFAVEDLLNSPYDSIVNGSIAVGAYNATWTVVQTVNGTVAKKDITVTARRADSATNQAILYNTITNGTAYAL